MNDKKANMALWDDLEGSVEDAIKVFASAATTKYEDLDELIDRAYEDGVIPEVRDRIVEFLESVGLIIPFVDGNY